MLTKQDLQDQHDDALENHRRETRLDGVIQWAVYAGAIGTIFLFPFGAILMEVYDLSFLAYVAICHLAGQSVGVVYHRVTGRYTPKPLHPGGGIEVAYYLNALPRRRSSYGDKRLAAKRKKHYYGSADPVNRRVGGDRSHQKK